MRNPNPGLHLRPLKLKIGTPVTRALWMVRADFVFFSTLFVFQLIL